MANVESRTRRRASESAVEPGRAARAPGGALRENSAAQAAAERPGRRSAPWRNHPPRRMMPARSESTGQVEEASHPVDPIGRPCSTRGTSLRDAIRGEDPGCERSGPVAEPYGKGFEIRGAAASRRDTEAGQELPTLHLMAARLPTDATRGGEICLCGEITTMAQSAGTTRRSRSISTAHACERRA